MEFFLKKKTYIKVKNYKVFNLTYLKYILHFSCQEIGIEYTLYIFIEYVL